MAGAPGPGFASDDGLGPVVVSNEDEDSGSKWDRDGFYVTWAARGENDQLADLHVFLSVFCRVSR